MTATVAEVEFRRADFSLSFEQRSLRESFAAVLAKECPSERVRMAEPLGFDPGLWKILLDMGIVQMGLPVGSGGDGAGLGELVLVAEEIGRRLAPVPFVEAASTARLVARCLPSGSVWLDRLPSGGALLALALHRAIPGRPQLVPAGAVADGVVGLLGDELLVASRSERAAHVANHACAPLARWDLGAVHTSRDVLLVGGKASAAFGEAVREWKLLMAAAQVGVAEGVLRRAVDYARERVAFGVPISTFQGVSHPLVDCHIAIVGARRLVWKAAWFADHEPSRERQLIPMAFAYACRTAIRSATVGVHTEGGLGVTLDSDMQLFFRRTKGWAGLAGDPIRELGLVADEMYGPQGS